MATASKEIKQPKPLPAPNSDFYELAETLPPEELAVVKQVRAFMETKVAPIITKYWVEDAFPFELLPAEGSQHRRPWNEGLRLQRRKRAAIWLGIDGDGAFRRVNRDVLRCPQRPGHGFHLPWRIRGAKTEVAPADGSLGKDRLLRPHRAGGGFRGVRRPADDCETRRRYLGHQRSEEMDR